jgi:hypothetical protein
MATRAVRIAAVSVGLVLGAAASLPGQSPGGYNVIVAPPKVNVQDKGDVWALDFQFKGPRVLAVDIPGRGRKTVWYVWYQVWNNTGQPRYFIPDFELLTDRGTLHHDEVLPQVQQEIARIEGVPGFDDLKNSVTIAAKPIPPSRPDANPAYVTGVAIFPDVVEKVPDVTRFSIFVSGLSNGWEVGDNGVIRRKTLQLNFLRRADARVQTSQAIRFFDYAWIYRGTGVKEPDFKSAAPKPGEGR